MDLVDYANGLKAIYEYLHKTYTIEGKILIRADADGTEYVQYSFNIYGDEEFYEYNKMNAMRKSRGY